MKMNSTVAAWLAATLVASNSAWGFTFDDIHYWVGEGTNRCALVVDWGGTAKAWGYRWNGAAPTLATVIKEVAEEDPRLHLKYSNSTYGFYLNNLAYDVNDVCPVLDMSSGTSSDDAVLQKIEYSVYNPDSPYAVYGEEYAFDYYYWNLLRVTVTEGYSTSQYEPTSGADSTRTLPNGWYVAAFGCALDLVQPHAAESPYGYKVISSSTAAKGPTYTEPSNVLGHPSLYMQGEYGGVVNPANPAWGTGRLFSLRNDDDPAPGYIVIAFDHDVVDDPNNPWGIDFIVFGNDLCLGDGSYYTEGDDPARFLFVEGENCDGDCQPAIVEVSQDGEVWFSSESWKYADSFAPTLAYTYNPSSPNTAIYSGNEYWGRPTKATYPIDPSVGFSDCGGLSLAQVCQRYNGSAGGTGYDLSQIVDLPVNAQGRKWFRYVRIKNREVNVEGDTGYSGPAIDAVADVAPVSGYRNWICSTFTWDEAWQTNLTAATVIAQNGLPNGLNCVYGLAPTEDVAVNVPFKVESFTPSEMEHVIKMLSPKRMTATPKGLVVKETASLNDGWKAVVPTLESSESQGDGTWLNTFKVPKGEGAFFKLALDE